MQQGTHDRFWSCYNDLEVIRKINRKECTGFGKIRSLAFGKKEKSAYEDFEIRWLLLSNIVTVKTENDRPQQAYYQFSEVGGNKKASKMSPNCD